MGALLKVLERHNSSIFLTTNRLGVFDDAMRSRASLVIPYRALGFKDRAKLWKTLIQSSGIVHTKVPVLMRLLTFTREIKNTHELALTLANGDAKNISVKIIQEVLESNRDIWREWKRLLIIGFTVVVAESVMLYIGWWTHTRPQVIGLLLVICFVILVPVVA